MKKVYLFGGTVLLLILIIFKFGNFKKLKPGLSLLATEVIEYRQVNVPENKKEGSCWTTSISAQSNPKAWRCSVDSLVYDPCFETDTKQVVCGVDPEDPSTGFGLILSENLPERGINPKEIAWKIKLNNGLLCSLNSGTAGDLSGELYFYPCNNKAVILGPFDNLFDKSQSIWKVKVAYLDDNYEQKGSTQMLDVIKVWK